MQTLNKLYVRQSLHSTTRPLPSTVRYKYSATRPLLPIVKLRCRYSATRPLHSKTRPLHLVTRPCPRSRNLSTSYKVSFLLLLPYNSMICFTTILSQPLFLLLCDRLTLTWSHNLNDVLLLSTKLLSGHTTLASVDKPSLSMLLLQPHNFSLATQPYLLVL